MGGAKGGSDFSPRGKSNAEVMRFCQAFMTELWRNIGPDTDVPAGDIGVGGREVGYMYGMYKKLARENTGTLTGKGLAFGGSLIRPEATGYGNVYFLQEMLKTRGIDLAGKRVCISGSGNVAQYTAEKLIELGAVPITMSDSDGYIYDPEGITREKLDYIMELKNLYRGRIHEYPEAVDAFLEAGILYAPGKAANAGGVSVSGLEMTQNAQHLSWSAEEVDQRLHRIMEDIHAQCVKYGKREDGTVNYVRGANVAGFMKVASAMMAQGIL